MTTPHNGTNPGITPGTNPRSNPGTNPGQQQPMRIGDPERTRAIDYLSDRFANGYLSPAEFDERTGLVTKATLQSELDALLADLPSPTDAGSAESGSVHATATNGHNGLVASGNPYADDHDAELELDRIKHNGRKLEKISASIWAITIIVMLVCMVTDIWDSWWVLFPLAAVGNWVIYRFMGQSSEDVEIYDKMKEDQAKDKRERLDRAYKRRKELGY